MVRSHYLIDLFLLILGLTFVLASGYFTKVIIVNLFQALGTGLIAASMVSFLISLLHSEKIGEDIKIEDYDRINIENKYNRLREKARVLDIAGIALGGALNHFIREERLLDKIFLERADVRLIFLNPLSNYVEQRAKEDGEPISKLKEKLKASVKNSEEIYKILKKLYDKYDIIKKADRERIGSFEIRAMDVCPYFTFFKKDDLILWGLYTCDKPGTESAVLRVEKENAILSKQLDRHFEKLWNNHQDNWLVLFHRNDEPYLNEQLIKKLLKA